MSEVPHAQPAEPTSKPRRRWIPFAVAAVVLIGIVAVVAAVSGGDDDTTGTTGNTVADTAVGESVVSDGSTTEPVDTTAGLGSTDASSTSQPAVASTTTNPLSTTPAGSSPAATEPTGSTPAGITTTLPAAPATPGIDLGRADSFALLGNTAVESVGASVVTGQIGASNGDVRGFSGSGNPAGMTIVGSQAALQAQLDVDDAVAAIDSLAPTELPGDQLGADNFGPGTYRSANLDITGTVTLDAGGDPSAVFVFESPGALTITTDSRIVLVGGAQACNVYWRLVSSASLGSDVTLVGTVIADDSVAAGSGSNVDGRLIARNGAVTLDGSSIAVSSCA